MTYEKTVCFGTCPVYSVKIFENGTIKYHGIDFVNQKGTKVTQVSPGLVQSWIHQARSIGIHQMPSFVGQGPDQITDLPSTIISIGKKKVETRGKIPSNLQSFLDQLHHQFNSMFNIT